MEKLDYREEAPKYPSEKQRQSCLAGLQDPLIQAAFRPQRDCRECGAPYNFNHHEKCWTGDLELRLSNYETEQAGSSDAKTVCGIVFHRHKKGIGANFCSECGQNLRG